MRIPIQKQVEFIQFQIQGHEDAFKSYMRRNLNSHFADRTAFWGKIWGIDEKRGNLILKFESGMPPRLNMPLSAFLFKGVPNFEKPKTWNFSYEKFRLFYAKLETNIRPIFYMESNNSGEHLIGCREVESDFLEKIRPILQNGKRPSIVLAERDPPVQYLLNLKSFISSHKDDLVLNSSLEKSFSQWEPEKCPVQGSKPEFVASQLEQFGELLIQGPPGTGKSHLIAEIAATYLGQGNSVCITSLTNKALTEVAEKPGLATALASGRVYKTNLTLTELSQNNKLKQSDGLGAIRGNLLLATYYKLSEWYDDRNPNRSKATFPLYDLIIIEEASQCFLATIAAFKRLGKRVLIVGDPMQLPPIIMDEVKSLRIHPGIRSFAHGLAAYAANSVFPAYLLNQTYRLSPLAAAQTGIFYKGQLESIQKTLAPLKSSPAFQSVIPVTGETRIKFIPQIGDGDNPKEAMQFAVDLLLELRKLNPEIEVAVLAPFKKTVLGLQEMIGGQLRDQSGITVETIDKIQGLTVDFAIFLLALSNPGFAMNLNRFNVATSRARKGTLVITDKEYIRFLGIDPLVTQYLAALKHD